MKYVVVSNLVKNTSLLVSNVQVSSVLAILHVKHIHKAKYCSFDERFMSLGFKNWTSDLSKDVQDYGGYSPSSCYTTLVALQSLIGNSWYVRIQVEV